MSEVKTPIRSLNGHALVDEQARTDIETLNQDMTKLDGDLGVIKGNTSTVNIKTYGAVGDGATDDTAAIAAAIAACPENGTVYVPDGTFRVSDIVLKSNMRITGNGATSIIKWADGVTEMNHNCITANNVSNVIIDHLHLDGNRANNTIPGESKDGGWNCVHSRESDHLTIDNVIMHSAGYHGVHMFKVTDVLIRDCHVYDCGYRPLHGHSAMKRVRLIGNECHDCGAGDENADTPKDAVFFFDGIEDLLIEGNYVHNVKNQSCCEIGGNILAADDGEVSSNIRIINNLFVANDDGTPNVYADGVMLMGGGLSNVWVMGNEIRNARYGIFFTENVNNSDNHSCYIISNRIHNCQQYAIRHGSNRDTCVYRNTSIVSNKITSYGTQCGIQMEYSQNIIVKNNDVSAGATSQGSNKCIYANHCDRVISDGNILTDCDTLADYGIWFSDTSNNCNAINNIVKARVNAVRNDSTDGVSENNLVIPVS